jgi:hypothetical protein
MTQLRNHLLGRTQKAMDETIEEIKVELIKFLKDKIYDDSVGWYNRTEDLLEENAWIKSSVGRNSKGEIAYQLEYDDTYWETDPFEKIHGVFSNNASSGDTTLPTAEDFINVLNEHVGDAFGDNNSLNNIKGFWDEFLNWVQDHFDEIFAKHLAENGINVLYK